MPIVIQQTCIVLVLFLTTMRTGHAVGAEALAGLSLGTMTYNLLAEMFWHADAVDAPNWVRRYT